jgi:hypothetical protein
LHPLAGELRLDGHLIGAREMWEQGQFRAAFAPTVTLRRWAATEWCR